MEPPLAVVVEGTEAEGMEVGGTALLLVGRHLLHSTPTSREGTAVAVVREGMEHLRVRARGRGRGRAREGMELVPLLPLSSRGAGMELVDTELVLVATELVLLVVLVVHQVEDMASHSVLRPSMMLRDLPLELIFSYGSGLSP